MEKIYVITDTASDLKLENYRDRPLSIIPFWINFSENSYRDRIDLFPEEFYQLQSRENPKTSTPSVLDVEKELQRIKNQGYTHVLCITLSSVLSGIFNVFSLAESTGLEIFVFDTKTVAMAEGFFAHYALERIEAGVGFEDITKELIRLRSNTCTYFTVPNLQHLKEGGRISYVKGTFGDLLNIKPIITVTEEGFLKPMEQIKGRKKSILKLANLVKSNLKGKNNYYLGLSHGNAKEELDKLQSLLEEEIEQANFFETSDIATVLATHAGPGVLAVFMMIFD
ncbi:MAG: DegV family protein [Tissierellia bacterium]|nr:DegV family protein [Tissierellia bacterium]